jgi:hypothetical protein
MLLLFTLSGVDGSSARPGGRGILPPPGPARDRLGLVEGDAGGEEKDKEGSGLGGTPSAIPSRVSSREAVSSRLVVVESRMLSNSEGERRESRRCWLEEREEVEVDGSVVGTPLNPMVGARECTRFY